MVSFRETATLKKMLDMIAKLAKRKGPKYFEPALTRTPSVAAALSYKTVPWVNPSGCC